MQRCTNLCDMRIVSCNFKCDEGEVILPSRPSHPLPNGGRYVELHRLLRTAPNDSFFLHNIRPPVSPLGCLR